MVARVSPCWGHVCGVLGVGCVCVCARTLWLWWYGGVGRTRRQSKPEGRQLELTGVFLGSRYQPGFREERMLHGLERGLWVGGWSTGPATGPLLRSGGRSPLALALEVAGSLPAPVRLLECWSATLAARGCPGLHATRRARTSPPPMVNLQARKKVLRQLGYLDDDGVVTLKVGSGRYDPVLHGQPGILRLGGGTPLAPLGRHLNSTKERRTAGRAAWGATHGLREWHPRGRGCVLCRGVGGSAAGSLTHALCACIAPVRCGHGWTWAPGSPPPAETCAPCLPCLPAACGAGPFRSRAEHRR